MIDVKHIHYGCIRGGKDECGHGYFAFGDGVKDGKTYHVATHCRLKTENGAKTRIRKMASAYDDVELSEVYAFPCPIIDADLEDGIIRRHTDADILVTYHGDLNSCLRCSTTR